MMGVPPEGLASLKALLSRAVEAAAGSLSALSQQIWSQPELAYQESRAHDALCNFFQAAGGWQVKPHYHLDTAFRADWGPDGGLTVGFLCEYDALPEIGHACGHNLIAEVGAASSLALRAVLETLPDLKVKVSVIGTPAEEDAGGKIDLIQFGAFNDLDMVLMAHPSQEDASYLPDMALNEVTVRYFGKATHAADYPWEGVNALDAAVLAYTNLSVLRQQLKPDWKLHGIFKHGGVKPNIIPSYSELLFYLRTSKYKDLCILCEKATQCFKAAGLATGCQVELEFAKNVFYNVLPNETLRHLYEVNGRSLGMEFKTFETPNTSSGSTDFGNVSFIVPGIHPYFHIGTSALNHSEEYTEAAGSKEAQYYTLRTAKALAMTALDVVLNPDLLQQMKGDFKKIKFQEQTDGV
ncbi:peptidase M20 domain-containing protein 2-like isoform X1 [Carcharodon carcharias]|uniref:peptidase M20 domain-containing protein 2-like isoform X1 n=1 Tax=Carcharodon carcharias TaxID=13397 RepID=UPI001B7DB186|nr:peptidase M20 domain-containing protein 2-like isoform X1 [Carcharodon carcharias]